MSKQSLGSNQPQEAVCPGIKRTGAEADHSPPIPRLRKGGAIPTFFLCVLDVNRDSFSSIFNLTNTVRKAIHSPAAFDFLYTHKVELHLTGLSGTANHPDTQKIQIIGFFFQNRLQ